MDSLGEMSIGWMAWNLWLAAVPVLLSLALFREDRHPSAGWWLCLLVFVAFLPNAPYVLTDVVHFAGEVRATDSDLHVAFLIIPKYAVFFVLGFGCYGYALLRLERWLRWRGWGLPRVYGVDLTLHALCAVGVFLGRVFRFNSWDLATNPGEVASVVRIPQPQSVAVVTLTFVVLAAGTAVLRALAGIRHQLVVDH
jgi:uncharacterized membrane protein